MPGMNVFEANRPIIDDMKKDGSLLKASEIIAFLSALLALQEAGHLPGHGAVVHLHGCQRSCRSKALDEITKVTWIPHWGEERIADMVDGRPDWCISRQRSWGVPIPAFTCEDCGNVIVGRSDRRPRRGHLLPRRVELLVLREAPASFCRPGRSARPAGEPGSARRTTSWTSGSNPAPAITSSARGKTCPGRPTSTSKATTSTGAGSTARS